MVYWNVGFSHAQESTHNKGIMCSMAQRITIILQGKCTSCLIFNYTVILSADECKQSTRTPNAPCALQIQDGARAHWLLEGQRSNPPSEGSWSLLLSLKGYF
jgi:hypothetical protein